MSIDVFDGNLRFADSPHPVNGDAVIVLFRFGFSNLIPHAIQNVIASEEMWISVVRRHKNFGSLILFGFSVVNYLLQFMGSTKELSLPVAPPHLLQSSQLVHEVW
jgi:hypothetical protein